MGVGGGVGGWEGVNGGWGNSDLMKKGLPSVVFLDQNLE